MGKYALEFLVDGLWIPIFFKTREKVINEYIECLTRKDKTNWYVYKSLAISAEEVDSIRILEKSKHDYYDINMTDEEFSKVENALTK